jgi:sec-independent protein translocase protein TatC
MPQDQPQPFLAHLIELRRRLIYSFLGFFLAFAVCYLYSQEIFAFLIKPLAQLLIEKGGERRLIYTGLTEAFLTYIKVAAFAAAFISFPVVAVQIWLFIAPGLYQHERKIFLPLLCATPLLFLIGAAFAYAVVFPLAYQFFLSFETTQAVSYLPIQLEAKINEYLSFVMRLVFSFGICFELPVLLTLLASIGAVTAKGLMRKWRLAVVGIFALSALITPPDIFSMISLALPLVTLYGCSIGMVLLIERQRNRREQVCLTYD